MTPPISRADQLADHLAAGLAAVTRHRATLAADVGALTAAAHVAGDSANATCVLARRAVEAETKGAARSQAAS